MSEGQVKIEITFDINTRVVNVSFPQDEMVCMYMMQKAMQTVAQQFAAMNAPKVQGVNGAALRPFRPLHG